MTQEPVEKIPPTVDNANDTTTEDIKPVFVEAEQHPSDKIVEEGEFLSEEEESTMCKVDLSAARGIVRAYQINSEPGCQSCTELSRETLDAQDASTGRYCGDSDPDFVDGHVRYSGNSPKVKEHYNFPCSVWKPRFSQTLGELLKDES